MATNYPPQHVPTARSPSTLVELHISCQKLKDMDVFSKSDPIVSVRVKDPKSGSWREVSAGGGGGSRRTQRIGKAD